MNFNNEKTKTIKQYNKKPASIKQIFINKMIKSDDIKYPRYNTNKLWYLDFPL